MANDGLVDAIGKQEADKRRKRRWQIELGGNGGTNERNIANVYRTAEVDIRVRVRGGGHTSQIYAIRQAIAKSIVRSHLPPIHPVPRGRRTAQSARARDTLY